MAAVTGISLICVAIRLSADSPNLRSYGAGAAIGSIVSAILIGGKGVPFTVWSLPSGTIAATGFLDFLSKHLLVAALLISAGWFYAGHQYFIKRDRSTGVQWQLIAVLILIAFCINIILSGGRAWLNLILAVLAIAGEIWLMCRSYFETKGDSSQ